MKKTNNSLAIIFDDLTEFFVMQPAIDAMKKTGIKVDIIVPYDSGYNHLAEHTFERIKSLGYSPLKDAPKNIHYKVLLTPYPGLDVVKRLDYVYHIRYPYGAITAKPNPTCLPDAKIAYDAILSFNTYDTDFLDAYGAKVYPVPYWRYYNFKKSKNKKNKPTLLILPTFGSDTSCANSFTVSSIKALKEQFFIIVKAHHAIHFGIDGQETVNKLKVLADDYYDSDISIEQLLKKADLVLSDNSGAIFESICAGIPVALFAKTLNSRHYKTIDTPQFLFVKQGIIPHTSQANQILPMLLNIQSYSKKQQILKEHLFIKPSSSPFKQFIDIIKQYLDSNEATDYRKVLHDALVEEWHNREQTIKNQESQIDQLTNTVNNLLNSTSWKITKPLRSIKTRGKKNVQK